MPDPDPSGAEAAREPRSAPSHRTEGRSPRHRGRSASNDSQTSPAQGQGKPAPVYAAVDLGTNNCRLLIAKPNAQGKRGIRVIDSYSEVVKLGDGLGRTGRLSDRSMDASIGALKVCAEKIHRKNTTAWRCVATQACRQAENGQEFIKRVREEVGLRMEIISPRVEARLSVMGCVNLVDTKKKVALVVDIGGGSTELSWVDIGRLKRSRSAKTKPPINAWASLPVGVATLSEMFPEHDDRDAWYGDMKAQVRKCIVEQSCESHFSQVFRAGDGHIIGTSGTITSLAGVHLKLPYYQRKRIDGLWMPTASAVEIARDLASRDIVSRASVPSIGEDRASLLVAGCAIMDVLCEMWPSERIRVADRGLREGILMGLMHRPRGRKR
jgi:exopolyphosphatase/guanosine-5'-triphosphate,3'-diphosphate pyrophosphatase